MGRAALSVHLYLAEGFSKKFENQRKRYNGISEVAVIDVGAALDVANDLEYLQNYNLTKLGEIMDNCF